MRHPVSLFVVFVAACSSNVNIDVSGLAPLTAVGPGRLAPRARGNIKTTGGAPPYRYAFAADPPASGRDAELDASSGELRLGSIGRVTEVVRVTDKRGETRMASIDVSDALAVDPTRAVVDPFGLADFDALGGQPPYVYAIDGVAVDRVDPATGILVAGSEGGRTATVVVTDANGAQARAEVQITLNFAAGNAPNDVVALDLNRDGVLDLAVAPANGGVLELLLGRGDGNFEPWRELPLLAFPRALRAIDLNGDGQKDLLVAASSPDALIVLVQDVGAVGGFREVARQPVAALPADVDVVPLSDGSFAAVTASDAGRAADVTRLRVSGGQATVMSSVRIPLGGRGTRLAVGDFVGDAQIDLAVGVARPQPSKGSVVFFAGNGSGGFGPTAAAEVQVGEGTVALAAGRLGGGAKDDVAATSSLSNELGLILDDPSTGQPSLQRYPIPAGDGTQCAPCGRGGDAACVQSASCVQLRAGAETQVCALGCMSNDDCPNGTDCQQVAMLGRVCAPQLNACPVTSMIATGLNPRAVHIVDLDLDGTPEIAVSTVSDLQVFKAASGGAYQHAYTAATGANPWEIEVADLNHDGFPDLVTANRFGQNVTVLPGLGRLLTQIGEYQVGWMPGLIAIADLDHDPAGARDVVLQTGDAMLTLLGDGRGRLTPYRRLPFFSPGRPNLVDIDHDGFLDLLAFHGLARTFEFVPWESGVGFTGGPETSTGLQPLSLALADLNGDGKLDAVVANNLDRNYAVHWGRGDGAFTPYGSGSILYSYQDPSILSFDVLAAVKTDGTFDHLVTIGRGSGNTYLDSLRVGSEGMATSTWSQTVAMATGFVPALLDCDGDGRQDFALLYVSVAGNAFDGQVWRARADGTYVLAAALHTGLPAATPDTYTATGPDSLVVEDFTGDGKADLVVSTRLVPQLVVFSGNGDCTFASAGRVQTSQTLSGGMAAGDLDGDGRPDLAASVQPDKLVVFQNMGTRTGELRSFPAAGRLCDLCSSDADCGTGADLCADRVGMRRLCARDCSGGKACPSGFTCKPMGQAEQCVHAGDQCVF